MNYYDNPQAASGPMAPMNQTASAPTIKQRLAMAVTQAKERLAAVERAKEILDKNPDLEELLNIMQKSHF